MSLSELRKIYNKLKDENHYLANELLKEIIQVEEEIQDSIYEAWNKDH